MVSWWLVDGQLLISWWLVVRLTFEFLPRTHCKGPFRKVSVVLTETPHRCYVQKEPWTDPKSRQKGPRPQAFAFKGHSQSEHVFRETYSIRLYLCVFTNNDISFVYVQYINVFHDLQSTHEEATMNEQLHHLVIFSVGDHPVLITDHLRLLQECCADEFAICHDTANSFHLRNRHGSLGTFFGNVI